jgi:hypothetical protein
MSKTNRPRQTSWSLFGFFAGGAMISGFSSLTAVSGGGLGRALGGFWRLCKRAKVLAVSLSRCLALALFLSLAVSLQAHVSNQEARHGPEAEAGTFGGSQSWQVKLLVRRRVLRHERSFLGSLISLLSLQAHVSNQCPRQTVQDKPSKTNLVVSLWLLRRGNVGPLRAPLYGLARRSSYAKEGD